MELFQIVCFSILAIAYLLTFRLDKEAIYLAPLIFISSWIAESSSIYFYGFYYYPDHWWFKIAGVPLLIPLIWPIVILSGRMVIRALIPDAGRFEPWLIGAIVFIDASMVEVCAVACKLWAWTVPGYLGVPFMGVMGWALFAAIAYWILQKAKGLQKLSVIILAPALLHLALLATWWGAFRWILRGDWFWLFGVMILGILAFVLRVRNKHMISMQIAGIRILAAIIFIATVFFVAPTEIRVWLHILLVAVPYALATDFRLNPV